MGAPFRPPGGRPAAWSSPQAAAPTGPRRSQRSREAPPRRPRARARNEGRRHFRLRARRPPPLSPRTARRPADFIPRPLHSPATPSPRARHPPGLTRGPLGPPRAHLSARPSVCPPARRLRGSAAPRLRGSAPLLGSRLTRSSAGAAPRGPPAATAAAAVAAGAAAEGAGAVPAEAAGARTLTHAHARTRTGARAPGRTWAPAGRSRRRGRPRVRPEH